MSLRWSDDEARLLTRLREQAGLDRATFARRNTLSPAQLAELEDGGQGRFYNDRIKAHTGHTLLRKLGHTPAGSAAARAGLLPDADRPTTAPPVATTATPTPRPARMSEPVPLPVSTPAAPGAVKVAMGVLALAVVGVGLFVVTDPDRMSAIPAVAALATTSTEAPVVQNPTPLPAASAQAPAADTAGETVAAAAADVLPSVSSSPGCGPVPQAGVTRATPPGAIRPANYVHFESTSDVSVCVVDATGKPTAAVVGPGEGLSIFGAPPFVVQAARWNDLRVFFQGMRMHVDLSAPPTALALDPR